ncbi:malonyl-CoA O-methyltransferase [uncultured Gammaproteobacteria bacterium]
MVRGAADLLARGEFVTGPAGKSPAYKSMVASAFGAAASGYEATASVQKQVAERLAARIAAEPLPEAPRILELGCGTGFLTRAIAGHHPQAHWLVTDLSPTMVRYCRDHSRFPRASASFVAMDGERPSLTPTKTGGFDLICTSLAMQWFTTPAETLAELAALLAPGGLLAWSTLAAGTFAEWRQVHAELGLVAGVPNYPEPATLAGLWPTEGDANGHGQIETERLVSHHADGYTFLRVLRAIGADVPVSGHHPLPAGALRRVLRRFAAPDGISVSHVVAFGLFRRAGPDIP